MRLQAIMGDHTMPPQVNIYKNECNQARADRST